MKGGYILRKIILITMFLLCLSMFGCTNNEEKDEPNEDYPVYNLIRIKITGFEDDIFYYGRENNKQQITVANYEILEYFDSITGFSNYTTEKIIKAINEYQLDPTIYKTLIVIPDNKRNFFLDNDEYIIKFHTHEVYRYVETSSGLHRESYAAICVDYDLGTLVPINNGKLDFDSLSEEDLKRLTFYSDSLFRANDCLIDTNNHIGDGSTLEDFRVWIKKIYELLKDTDVLSEKID